MRPDRDAYRPGQHQNRSSRTHQSNAGCPRTPSPAPAAHAGPRGPPALGTSYVVPAADRVLPPNEGPLHRLDLASDPLCRECGAEDTVRHLLTECPAFASTRRRLWGGPVPSLDDVLSGPPGKILDYIRRVGRSEPPLDQPPPDAPAGASA